MKIFASFFYCLLKPRLDKNSLQIEARPVSTVRPPDDSSETLPDNAKTCFYRSHAVVNWMLQYPWITEDASLELNYRFSYKEKLFRYLAFEFCSRENGKRKGYAVFSLKSTGQLRIMKILDCELSDKKQLPFVLDLALREALRRKVDVIEVSRKFHPCIKKNPLLRALTASAERGNFLHLAPSGSALQDHLQNLQMDISDGDQAFC